MTPFVAKRFNIPALKGMSAKSIEEHLKLYAGYVKNANAILEWIEKYSASKEDMSYGLGELHRRFSFEYSGMRNHEVYFSSLERGAAALPEQSMLKAKIAETWGSYEVWLENFKKTAAATRGIGWMMLWYDRADKRLINSWVDEQHLGQLQDCALILGLDMWEHSYVADYQPSGKKAYIEDFFANLNWEFIEANFKRANNA